MNDSNSVLHKIANLYAEQLMSDICLVVGENRYPAHRVILCASSEVFQVMLMNPQWNECRESVIELKEEPCCLEVFPQFLKYLYVGQIRMSLQTVMPMLALADKYNIKVGGWTVFERNAMTWFLLWFHSNRTWFCCAVITCWGTFQKRPPPVAWSHGCIIPFHLVHIIVILQWPYKIFSNSIWI